MFIVVINFYTSCVSVCVSEYISVCAVGYGKLMSHVCMCGRGLPYWFFSFLSLCASVYCVCAIVLLLGVHSA